MAERAGEIVYQKEGPQGADCAASDDQALIRSYDQAVGSYKDALGSDNKDQASKSSESSVSSGTESEGDVEEEEEKEEEGSQWKVGDACCAVWSGDGLLYPARVVSLSTEGGGCVVEYEHYGNREAQKLRDLLPPDGSPDSTQQPGRTWKAGDVCSAVWAGDGLLYPATVRAVDAAAGTCLVEFDGYGNKEQQALEDLLPPGGALDGDPGSWRAEEEAPGSPREPPHVRRRRGTKGGWVHHVPPPPKAAPLPPPPRRGRPGAEGEDEEEEGALACMLLAWHMSGYHTGFYMGLREGRAQAAAAPPKLSPRRKASSPRR